MFPKVVLQVTRDSFGFLIDGKREFDFVSGVEYVLESTSDLWVRWNEQYREETFEKIGNRYHVHNLTCKDHHRYAADSLLYYSQFSTIGDLSGVPFGLLGKEVENVVDPSILGNDVQDYVSQTVLPQRRFLSNSSFEALFNLEQENWISPETLIFPSSSSQETRYEFQNSDRYIAILDLDERVSPDLYKTFFVHNGDSHFIEMSYVPTNLRIFTDLCHNARNNGSKRVSIVVREGDERRFYINDANGRNLNDLVGRGKPSPKEIVSVRNQFDSYVMSNFPELFNLINLYYSYENLSGTGTSFIRNMSDFFDVDKMEEEILVRKIKQVFPSFDSVIVEPRLFAKRMIDFFKTKGSVDAFAWLGNVFFGKELTVYRYSDDVIRLSQSTVRPRTEFYLCSEDIERIRRNDSIFDFEDLSTESIAKTLVGFTIHGRSTNSTGLVEEVTVVRHNRREFLLVSMSVKNGSFSDDENYDVKNLSDHISLNTETLKKSRIGIVGVQIEDGASGYSLGERVLSSSKTGNGFVAFVNHVDDDGKIKSVKIENSGWSYDQHRDTELSVENDSRIRATKFEDIDLNKSLKILSGNIGYVNYDKEVHPLKFDVRRLMVGTISVDYKNVFMNIVAAGRSNSELFVFRTDASRRKIFSENGNRTNRIKINIDSDVVGLSTNDRSLFVLTDVSLYSVSLDEVHSENPKWKRIVVKNSFGKVRAVFVSRGNMYGLTRSNLLKISPDGTISRLYQLDREYTYGYSKKTGSVETVYLGSDGDLYSNQFFGGSKKAVLRPIFGRKLNKFLESESLRNTLSGNSKIQDNDLYQFFSIGTQIDESTDLYLENFKSINNPAGFKVTGIYPIQRKDMMSNVQSDIRGSVSSSMYTVDEWFAERKSETEIRVWSNAEKSKSFTALQVRIGEGEWEMVSTQEMVFDVVKNVSVFNITYSVQLRTLIETGSGYEVLELSDIKYVYVGEDEERVISEEGITNEEFMSLVDDFSIEINTNIPNDNLLQSIYDYAWSYLVVGEDETGEEWILVAVDENSEEQILVGED